MQLAALAGEGASSSRNVAGVSTTAAFLFLYFLFALFGSAGLCAWSACLSIHVFKLFVSRCNTRAVIFIPRRAAVSAAARHSSSGNRVRGRFPLRNSSKRTRISSKSWYSLFRLERVIGCNLLAFCRP
jgi:hypothetical protein